MTTKHPRHERRAVPHRLPWPASVPVATVLLRVEGVLCSCPVNAAGSGCCDSEAATALAGLRQRGLKLAALPMTESRKAAVDALDAAALLPLFDVIVTPDPASDRPPLQQALHILGRHPSRTAIVTPFASDIEEARPLKILTIGALYAAGGEGTLHAGADRVIQSIADLPDVIAPGKSPRN